MTTIRITAPSLELAKSISQQAITAAETVGLQWIRTRVDQTKAITLYFREASK